MSSLPHNDDVKWDGTIVGLEPALAGSAAQRVLARGAGAIDDCIAALADAERFVAAHVLLTFITGVQLDPAPWNGLAVTLAADGSTRIEADQRHALARRWQAWRAAQQRP